MRGKVRSDMRTSTYPLYDRILNGRLGELLMGWRDEGASPNEMAYRLRDRGVTVSPDTVRRWLKTLDAEAVA